MKNASQAAIFVTICVMTSKMVNVLKIVLIGHLLFSVTCDAKKRKVHKTTTAATDTISTTVATSTKSPVTRRHSKAHPSTGEKVKVSTPVPKVLVTTTTATSTTLPPVAAQQVMSPTLAPVKRTGRELPLVYLEVLDAKIGTDYDWLSSTDCFVTIEVKNPDIEASYSAGKTRVAYDMINPEFYQVFKLDKLRTDSMITFKLFDNDYWVDETIGEVTIEVEKVLRTDQNYQEIKLTFNDDHDYVAIRIMMIATLVDYSDDRRRNEVSKDSLLITCCAWDDFKIRTNDMNGLKSSDEGMKEDIEYIVQFSSFFDDILMRQICSEKYFHKSFCSRLNSTDPVPIYDQMLSTLLINL